MNLCVVGCGSVGSALLHLVGIKSVEYDIPYKKIIFVDPDIITDSTQNHYSYPKVFEIEDLLIEIGCPISLVAVNLTFESYYSSLSESDINNTIFIDCRDSNEQSSIFYIKIYSDGPYGHIIKNPENNDINKFYTNYKIKNSKYYSLLTVSHIVDDILNLKEKKFSSSKQTEFVINHLCSK